MWRRELDEADELLAVDAVDEADELLAVDEADELLAEDEAVDADALLVVDELLAVDEVVEAEEPLPLDDVLAPDEVDETDELPEPDVLDDGALPVLLELTTDEVLLELDVVTEDELLELPAQCMPLLQCVPVKPLELLLVASTPPSPEPEPELLEQPGPVSAVAARKEVVPRTKSAAVGRIFMARHTTPGRPPRPGRRDGQAGR